MSVCPPGSLGTFSCLWNLDAQYDNPDLNSLIFFYKKLIKKRKKRILANSQDSQYPNSFKKFRIWRFIYN
jgi:hypothetical protein